MADRYGLSIRAAVAADAPGLGALFGQAELSLGEAGLAARIEALRAGDGAVLLAESWGPPSGVVALSWRWTLEAAAPVAWASTLLVAPEERRRGIGRLLLKAASQAARSAGCGELHVWAPERASGLQAFCLATGFIERGAVLARPLRKQG